MMKRLAALGVAGFVACAAYAPAQASLIGDDVTFSYFAGASGPLAGTPLGATVADPGVEFVLFGLRFDVGESSIFISNGTTGTVRFPYSSAERFEFDDLEWRDSMGTIIADGIITGLTVIPTDVDFDADAPPGNPPFGDANVSFTDHKIIVDMAGYVFDPGTTLEIQIETSHDTVPEPATVALLGLGLVGLGVAARRRR